MPSQKERQSLFSDMHICPVCGQQTDPMPDNEQSATLGEVLDGPDIYSVAEYEALA